MIKLKHIFIILFLLISYSCEDLIADPQMGCLSGIYPGTNTRQWIDCLTKSEYAASGNTFYGVTYDNIIWTEVNECQDCGSIDYDNL
ncbi:MAG: hypothetical protein CMO01_26980 [Thalassobius sp.]|nr:hypothetical protein [Thalassovita sp.]